MLINCKLHNHLFKSLVPQMIEQETSNFQNESQNHGYFNNNCATIKTALFTLFGRFSRECFGVVIIKIQYTKFQKINLVQSFFLKKIYNYLL